jgi:hypothetical protein
MSVEQVYNTYLSVSRGHQNKPWKARKDFEGFDKTPDGILCTRLDMFFKRFPQINIKDFLLAPYVIYKDEEHFPLNFYLTQKAIACYSLLQSQRAEELPDTDGHIKHILESLKYLANTCVNEKITLEQYCDTKTGYTWRCLEDYRNKHINLYVLLMLPNFEFIFDNLQLQDKELYLKSIYADIVKFKMRINNSTKAKKIILEGLKRISTLNQLSLDKRQ